MTLAKLTRLRNTPSTWKRCIKNPKHEYITAGDQKGIQQIMKKYKLEGRTLDLMSGAMGSARGQNSFALDFHRDVLLHNPTPNKILFNVNAVGKKVGDRKVSLPFKDQSFKNVTINFGINYLNKTQQARVLKEAKRILDKNQGRVIIVGAADAYIDELEKTPFNADEISEIMKRQGFKTEIIDVPDQLDHLKNLCADYAHDYRMIIGTRSKNTK